MADFDVIFEDNTAKILKATEDICEIALLEVSAEIVSQTARNTRVKTGQTKNSWASKVGKTDEGYEAVIGSPLENAIWEEFGTGEYALNGDGRKGGWGYVDEEGNEHWTFGKKPSRAFHKTYLKWKNKAIDKIKERIKELSQ